MARKSYRVVFYYVVILTLCRLGGAIAGLAATKWGVAVFCTLGVLVFGWVSWMISPSHLSEPPSERVLRYQNGLMRFLRIDSAVSPDQRRRRGD